MDADWIQEKADFAHLYPKTFRTMRFDTLKETEGIQDALRYSREFMVSFLSNYREGKEMERYPFLLLYGPRGVGKTHLAHALAWSLLEQQVNVRYYQTEELLDDMRSSFNYHISNGYEERINFLKRVPVLILDDVGAQADTDWSMAKLDMIVDYRYRYERALVMVTNDLKLIPPRILDRLKEGWSALISGESWRGNHGKSKTSDKRGK